MKKLIIFDLDGTLLNTSRDIAAALNKSLKAFSLPELSLSKTIEYVGSGAKNLVYSACGEKSELAEKVLKNFLEEYKNSPNSLTFTYPKEEETLLSLKNKGIKLAILTNKPQPALERVYAKFLAKFEFCIVLGQTEYFPIKPNPASTLYILDKLKVKKEDCLFVGDGEADVLTAKAAGVECLSALWGFRTKSLLEKSGATLFAENFCDIERFL